MSHTNYLYKNKGMKAAKLGSGLTLIEILVATVILGLLGAGLLTLQFILGKNQTLVISNYLSVDEANSHMAAFIREIRSARSGDNASYPLEVVDDNEIVFYSDVDYDGATERVRYTLSGTQFSRGVVEPTGFPVTYPVGQEKVKELTNNIRNGVTPVFYYYNSDWPSDTINNPLVQNQRLSQTRTVRIYLRLNQKANDPDSDYILESSSQIRMLKENL